MPVLADAGARAQPHGQEDLPVPPGGPSYPSGPTDGADVYQALLTRKYLTSKVMPLLAVAAVLLCTATVLIVWSIMGGFLVMLLSTGRGMVGDVIITWPTVGFAHYEDLAERLEADPMVAGATPVIEVFGVVTLPDDRVMGVQI